MLFASVLTNDSTRTLAVGLQGYATQNQVYWNQIMAASLTVSVPIVVGFLLLQRFLVAGHDGRLGQVTPVRAPPARPPQAPSGPRPSSAPATTGSPGAAASSVSVTLRKVVYSGRDDRRTTEQRMAQIVLDQVDKVYPGGVKGVDGLSLEIEDREFMVLVGPSGCGKSTTLRMIAGLEEITSGTVTIGGRVVNEVLPKDRDIAMVFQNYALYPHMTRATRTWPSGSSCGGSPRPTSTRACAEAATMLGLETHLARKPKALSGGQRQRVALGRAIVRKPKVFLFDEPLSNLDAKMRVSTRTGDIQAARPPWRHDDLCDPRPGGGDDHGRPDLRAEGRQHHAGRRAAGALQPPR